MSFRVEELGDRHDRSGFASTSEPLDRYIRERASQDMRRGVARVFVAVTADASTVAGLYTLSAGGIERTTLPEDVARRLPRYPVPVALLGRLAVDRRFQGRGLGAALLADALDRVRRASDLIGVYAVVVDPKDEPAASFYRHFGFLPLPSASPRLFLPLGSLPR